MPRARTYTSNASRQAAYRQRRLDQQREKATAAGTDRDQLAALVLDLYQQLKEAAPRSTRAELLTWGTPRDMLCQLRHELLMPLGCGLPEL